MTPLDGRDPRDRQHLVQVAVDLYRMGHAADTIAGALSCHEGLSLADAVRVVEDAGQRWSAALWATAVEGLALPALAAERVANLRALVTTQPPGAGLKVTLPRAPEPTAPPTPPAVSPVESRPHTKRRPAKKAMTS